MSPPAKASRANGERCGGKHEARDVSLGEHPMQAPESGSAPIHEHAFGGQVAADNGGGRPFCKRSLGSGVAVRHGILAPFLVVDHEIDGDICGGSSSITPPSTQAGSTWLRSRSASCGDSASLAGSTTPSDCVAKSPLGNGREMLRAHASNGCSRQKRPAQKWGEPTQTLPKSHNHCAEVLDGLEKSGKALTFANRAVLP
jgi:hypothetical protein